MIRKERLTSEERKQQIMDIAARLFAEKGFSGTRTREIADAAGISETLIFQHFKSKEELYRAILLENLAHHPIEPEIEQFMANNDDYAVFSTTACHLIRNMNDPLTVRLFLFGALEGPPAFISHRGEKGIKIIIGNYIQKRIEDGAYKSVNPYIAAQSFIGSVSMFCLEQVLANEDSKDLNNEFVDTLITVFLNGLTS